MARDQSDFTPIQSRDDLVSWLEAGCKPTSSHRIGTEHEKIPFRLADHRPVPYEGSGGIRALLDGMAARTGWHPIIEDDHPIGLFDPIGGGAISLEPGGQFELSGAPLADLHATAAELDEHLVAAKAVGAEIGVGFLDLALSPVWTRVQTPVMPKRRYRIMTNYMPKVGNLGLDMMYRTATVQVNLDHSSEADMVTKLRVGLALQPIVMGLFANSPFLEGKPNGFRTYRGQIWRDTDPNRTGLMPFAFEAGMGFERYVDYALDVPLYFVKRGEVYHDVAGASFRDLLAGKLTALPGERAVISDWANHLSTIFPEARLKRYLEMRGADAGPRGHLVALPALWTGLFYDGEALGAAWDLVKPWTAEERETLRQQVTREGISGSFRGRPVAEFAREVVALAVAGLKRRARPGDTRPDESHYLASVQQLAAEGRTLADIRLALLRTDWQGRMDAVFENCAY